MNGPAAQPLTTKPTTATFDPTANSNCIESKSNIREAAAVVAVTACQQHSLALCVCVARREGNQMPTTGSKKVGLVLASFCGTFPCVGTRRVVARSQCRLCCCFGLVLKGGGGGVEATDHAKDTRGPPLLLSCSEQKQCCCCVVASLHSCMSAY